jgi:hypothetical protein
MRSACRSTKKRFESSPDGSVKLLRVLMKWVDERPRSPYRGYRFPPEIISYCVWLSFRFSGSYRDIES